MISIMIIQEVINNTTGSPIMFDMRLVIGKSSYKINSFAVLNSFDQYLKFTMDIGGKSLNFSDLAISIEGNSLVTSVYSNPPMLIYIWMLSRVILNLRYWE